VSKHANVLRALRNRRITQRKSKGVDEPAATLPEALGLEDTRKEMETVKPPQPAITTEKQLEKKQDEVRERLPETMKPEDISARLEKAANGSESVVILHQRQPVFVIPASSIAKLQKEVKGGRAVQSRILKDILAGGVAETLKKYGAVPVNVEQKKEIAGKDQISAIRASMGRCLRLAFTAMDKNLIENPLKHHLYEGMVEAGIEDPIPVIETAIAQAMGPTLDLAFTEAEKYASMTDDAFVEVESQIEKAGVLTPRASSPEKDEAETMMRRASLGSMVPTPTSDPVEERRLRIRDVIPKVGAFTRF
jgi:hypothetical protein